MALPNHYTLIGAGIMSATLGVLIKELQPDARITIYERLDRVAAESSDGWNNAGTGHSAFCELNYTPLRPEGHVDISKALKISESFEVSKQLWAYLLITGKISASAPFINDIDHMSFVWGEDNIRFLKERYMSLVKYEMFNDMIYSIDHERIRSWIPLMMEGRDSSEKIAVTRMAIGTDVNFGQITRLMFSYLESLDGVQLHMGQEVQDLDQDDNGTWHLFIKDLHTDEEYEMISQFVFIGAGGGALKLLEMSDIPEGRGYGGFPVSGKFLRCNNPEVIDRHEAKVYGKAASGSPPMSVPHLDTRYIDGRRSLLFGPYAGFSTKFLKNGSYLDLPLSIEVHNIWPLLSAGVHNVDLSKYLIEQVLQRPEERFEALKTYYPLAKMEDWELITAGQRVQIIKKDEREGGRLQFGTEIVKNKENNLVALLGASPGASTAVSIMLDVIEQCMPELTDSQQGKERLHQIFPSYNKSLIEDGQLLHKVRSYTTQILKLEEEHE